MSYANYVDFKDIKKILVIKLRHLGDVLLATAVFYNLKKSLKNVKVHAFVNEESKDILKNNPYVDEIITYDRNIKKEGFFKRLKYEMQILKKIKKQKYDLVINLTEGDRGAIAAFFSKAKYKVGIDPEKRGFFKKEKIYTHIVKNPKTKRHIVERNLDALRRIGIFPKDKNKKLYFTIPAKAKESIKRILDENSIAINSYILIHPSTRWRFKCFDKFDELAKLLYEKKEKIVVVASNRDYEIELVDNIVNGLPILNLTGKVNIDELAALILFSKKFYCVDSFAFHLSSALKANVRAFFGPTCDVEFGPWQNENAKIIKSNFSCRPCSLDGCGGSKVSECLTSISIKDIDVDG